GPRARRGPGAAPSARRSRRCRSAWGRSSSARSARAGPRRPRGCRPRPSFLAQMVLEELLHPGEEALAFGAGLAAALALELLEELALAAGEVDRRFHLELDIHVAARLAAEHRHALAAQ